MLQVRRIDGLEYISDQPVFWSAMFLSSIASAARRGEFVLPRNIGDRREQRMPGLLNSIAPPGAGVG